MQQHHTDESEHSDGLSLTQISSDQVVLINWFIYTDYLARQNGKYLFPVYLQVSGTLRENVRLPVALVVTGGDVKTIEHVKKAVQNDISVTVIQGSGGAADLIASGEYSMKSLRRNIPVFMDLRLNDQVYREIENSMRIIHEKGWLVNKFDLQNDDATLLWNLILEGIIRAWASEGTIDDHMPDSSTKRLTIPRHVCTYLRKDGMTSRDIFDACFHVTGEKEKENLLADALLNFDTKMIEDLLKKHVTIPKEKLQRMYEENMEKNKLPEKLLLVIDKETTEKLYRKEITPEKAISIYLRILRLGPFLASIQFNSGDDTKDATSENSENDKTPNPELLLFAILSMDRHASSRSANIALTSCIWSQCDYPMYTALCASYKCRCFAEYVEEMYEDDLIKTFEQFSVLFLDRAVYILEKMFEHNKDYASKSLKEQYKVLDFEDSPLSFGHHFEVEEFLSHPAAQKDANRTLYKNSKHHTFFHLLKENIAARTFHSILMAPVAKIIVQYLFFLISLICFAVFVTTDLNTGYVSILEILVTIFVFGDFIEEMWTMFVPSGERGSLALKKVGRHVKNIWNILDILFYLLYFTGFTMHCVMMANGLQHMLLHTRRIYTAALFLMFMRLLKILLMLKSLGTIIIMMKEMLKDLFKFLVVLIVFLFAAGTVYHANIYPNHTAPAFPEDFDHWRIWTILKIPYWQVYGELFLDTIEGSPSSDCTNNASMWLNDPTAERCPQFDWFALLIAAIYMMLVNWLLLNIVIAMFSTQYERVMEMSRQKWRFHRHSVIMDYKDRIPSPFSILFRPVAIYQRVIGCRICCNATCLCACCEEEENSIDIQIILDLEKKFAEQCHKEEQEKDTDERTYT